jgi:hypothetical protein
MSQHDLTIANQGFPAFRSDLNNALQALGSTQAGSSAPSPTFAHQMWIDTSSAPNVLKVRNADNDAWITVGQLNQTADTFNLAVAQGGTGASTAAAAATNLAAEFGKLLYPVGSIYVNATSSTNPATLLGFGTWTAFGAGRVMVGFDSTDALFDSAEETGGSKDAVVVSHTHTFSGTTNTTGDHKHIQAYSAHASSAGRYGKENDTGISIMDDAFAGGDDVSGPYTSTTGNHSHTVSGTTASTGSSGTNANLQPYITVYMWKRTS